MQVSRFLQFFGLPILGSSVLWICISSTPPGLSGLPGLPESWELSLFGVCFLFVVTLDVCMFNIDMAWFLSTITSTHMCHYSLLCLHCPVVFFVQRRSSYVSGDWKETGHWCCFFPFVLPCFSFLYLSLFLLPSPHCIH
jgi:hypothetical protein